MDGKELIKIFRIWAQDRSCIQCWHWEDKKEMCKKFDQRPPAKVIVNGCEFHELIPF